MQSRWKSLPRSEAVVEESGTDRRGGGGGGLPSRVGARDLRVPCGAVSQAEESNRPAPTRSFSISNPLQPANPYNPFPPTQTSPIQIPDPKCPFRPAPLAGLGGRVV